MEAQRRGAKLIHVDPRFTRTSAVGRPARADPRRDRHRVPRRDRQLRPRARPLVRRVRQALHERLGDRRRGVPGHRGPRRAASRAGTPSASDYDTSSWQYEATAADASAGAGGRRTATRWKARRWRSRRTRRSSTRAASSRSCGSTSAATRRRWWRRSAACPRDVFLEVAEALCDELRAASARPRSSTRSAGRSTRSASRTSAPRRSSSCCSATSAGPAAASWRCAGTRPSRARPTSRRSTTSCPGYLPMPQRAARTRRSDASSSRTRRRPASGATCDAYIVSLLKAWWGDAATAENDFCFDYLPRIDGDHSTYRDGRSTCSTARSRASSLLGENPAVGSANSKLHRLAMAKLDWLVVRDLVEIESATLLEGRARDRDGRAADRGDRRPRSSSCPPPRTRRRTARSPTPSGCSSGTTRRSSRRATAAPSCGSCYHLGRADPREARRLDGRRATGRSSTCTWDYPTEGPLRGAERRGGAARDQRLRRRDRRRAVSAYTELKADGSTACGCWIYCGVYADERQPGRAPQAAGASRRWVAPEWGWAWPANRRILYNRASADPDGRPWSERKRYVWWDDEQGDVDGRRRARLRRRQARPTTAAGGRDGPRTRSRGDDPFIMQADGRGWLFAPSGLAGRAAADALRAARVAVRATRSTASRTNPARQRFRRADEPVQPDAASRSVFPYVAHHLPADRAPHRRAGCRGTLPYLVRAAAGDVLRGVARAGRRARARARRLGDDRHRAHGDRGARAGDRPDARRCGVAGPARCTRSGCPTTGARSGLVTGRRRRTTCSRSCSTRTCTSRSRRSATCDIRPGRRPRGPALPALVERLPRAPGRRRRARRRVS